MNYPKHKTTQILTTHFLTAFVTQIIEAFKFKERICNHWRVDMEIWGLEWRYKYSHAAFIEVDWVKIK